MRKWELVFSIKLSSRSHCEKATLRTINYNMDIFGDFIHPVVVAKSGNLKGELTTAACVFVTSKCSTDTFSF